ncbi:MAG: aminoacetone oxidase family FAD-binding enzyme [Desulfovibrionaceae bacterium]|nr:aminoacetone oxidase family FAD-binding enzyme [Desulfovibrionaceae bacterium]
MRTSGRDDGEHFDALVLGAGAAGLICAVEAARRGLAVALVDHQARAGRKLALAGGGMGNVTNRLLDVRHYVGADLSPCRAAFRRFGPDAVLALLAELNIPWEERGFGQIFCLRPARELADGLERLGREAGVSFRLGKRVDEAARTTGPDGTSLFRLRSEAGTLLAPQLVIATGGPACPQAGATDFGGRLAARWGHRVTPFRPALVPLIMPEDWPLRGLEGISLSARLSVLPADGGEPRLDPCDARPLLFTHRGLSGPAGLAASCLWNRGDTLNVDFLPAEPTAAWLHDPAHGKLLVRTLLARRLPERLAERLCPPDLARRKAAEVGKKDALRLADAVHRHRVIPSGTEGLRKAEAAAGGVRTQDLDSRLQSRLVPGLFFCGEVLDVTGLLGGYNLHWAFASAHLTAGALRAARGS